MAEEPPLFDVGGGQSSACWLAEGGGRLPVIQPTTVVPPAEVEGETEDIAAIAPVPDPIGTALDRLGPGGGVPGGAPRTPDVPG